MQKTLIYFADPMCSWCWGFSPVIADIAERFAERCTLRLIMGGLYPAPGKTMDPQLGGEIRKHWEHVASTAGAEFDYSFFDRQSFVYNTEPASRAVVAASCLDETSALPFMRRLQRAFYASNIDITSRDELIAQAQAQGFDVDQFVGVMDSENCAREVASHFAAARSAGVTGLPTLFAVDDSGSACLSSGYADAEQVDERLSSWFAEPVSQ